MATPNPTQPGPLFRAVASSTKPIQQLLKCIAFTNKVHVEIGQDTIKFAADNARVMQGQSRHCPITHSGTGLTMNRRR